MNGPLIRLLLVVLTGLGATQAATLQELIDAAEPGTTVLVPDGDHHETLTIAKPLHLAAANPGRATLTGAMAGPIVFHPDDAVAGLYAAAIAHEVRWVMLGDLSLPDFGTSEQLAAGILRSRRLPAGHALPRPGFARAPGRLLVMLADGSDPTGRVTVGRDHRGDGLRIVGTGPVTIADLVFRCWHGFGDGNTPQHAAIHLHDAVQVAIRDCRFIGCATAIRETGDSRGLVAERNVWSLPPLWHLRSTAPSQDLWRLLYDSNLHGWFIHAAMHEVTVRSNHLHDAFDCLQIMGPGRGEPGPPSEVVHNLIQRIADNPIEFDTGMRPMEARVHHNLILDTYTPLSLAPFQAGQVLIDHNLVINAPDFPLAGSSFYKPLWHEYANRTRPQRGVTIVHNTVAMLDAGSQPYTPGSFELGHLFQDVVVENNILLVARQHPRHHIGIVWSPRNLIHGPGIAASDFPRMLHATPGFRSLPAPDGTGILDVRLAEDSPAIGAGVAKDAAYRHTSRDGTDLGALEHGESWTFPRPGPRWMGDTALHAQAALPRFLAPAWAGLPAMP